MADELHSCPRCGGEIEGIAIWQNEQNKALHFEMDHGDMACHFDFEFSPAFLDMSLIFLGSFNESRNVAPMADCRSTMKPAHCRRDDSADVERRAVDYV
jgi:hypothetical protein